MSLIPVITTHKFNTKPQTLDYTSEVVKQSCFFKNKTYAITDYDIDFKDELFCNININELITPDFIKFNQCYEHMSTNPFEFEKISFNRFFLIKRFMEIYKYESIFHIDSDVLLYTNIVECKDFYISYDFTLSKNSCVSNSYLTYDMVADFCEKLLKVYELKERYFWYNDIKKIYQSMQAANKAGGICDMTFLKHYKTRKECNDFYLCGEMTSIIEDKTFDHHISDQDDYEFEDNHKKIKFVTGIPFCYNIKLEKDIQFLTLHFQGKSTKNIIYKYVTYNL